jgi:hypothetical protein
MMCAITSMSLRRHRGLDRQDFDRFCLNRLVFSLAVRCVAGRAASRSYLERRDRIDPGSFEQQIDGASRRVES